MEKFQASLCGDYQTISYYVSKGYSILLWLFIHIQSTLTVLHSKVLMNPPNLGLDNDNFVYERSKFKMLVTSIIDIICNPMIKWKSCLSTINKILLINCDENIHLSENNIKYQWCSRVLLIDICDMLTSCIGSIKLINIKR